MRFKRFTAGIVAAVMAVTAVGTPIADELPLFQNNSGVVAGAEENYDKTVCVGQDFYITISSRLDQNFIITGVDDSKMSYSLTGCGITISGHITYTKTYKVNITESGSYNLLIYGEYGAPLSYKVLVREHANDGTWHIDVKETCTSDGQKSRVCLYCNEKFDITVIPALGHDFSSEWTIDKDVTCVEDGEKSRHCTRCDEKTDVTKIPSVGKHDYIATVVKPTYTAQGYTLHKCSVCGYSYKDNETAKLTLAKVTGFKVKPLTSTNVTLQWNNNANASGYEIEQYKDGKWARVAKITKNSTTTYRASGLKASTVYKFRVKAYKMSGKTALYGAYSSTVSARTNPSVVKGAKLGGRAADALRINWNKNASADGYIVEMYQGNKWARVAKITNNSTTTFRKAGLKASTVYKFRVRAYKMSGSTALYGNYSATVTARTNPSVIKGVKIGGKAKDALRINWTKNTSAQGYIVEMYKGGKWVRVAKITNSNTTTFRKAGLAKNTTYKFRVKAYYMSGKTALYGGYGSVSGKTAAK